MHILQMSGQGGVLILVILALRLVALNRLPKNTFLCLWGMALFRLLCPVTVSSRLSVYRLFLPRTSTAPAPVVEETASRVILDTAQQVPAAQSAEFTQWSPLPVIWACGVVLLALWFALGYFRTWRILRFATRVQSPTLEDWRKSHRLRRPLEILETDRTATPVSVGLLRPRIILPLGMAQSDARLLGHVLTHEWVHLKRLDMLWKLLLLGAVCLHWFNPLVWVMLVFANRDLELSCDESTLRFLGLKEKKAYAASLILLCEQRSHLSPVYCSFSQNPTKERVVSIMKLKKRNLISGLLALVLVVGVCAGFATSASADNGTWPLDIRNRNLHELTDAEISELRALVYEQIYPEFLPDDGRVFRLANAGCGVGWASSNGDIACLLLNGGTWHLEKGQEVSLDLTVPNARGNGVSVGYILIDENCNASAAELVSKQITGSYNILFTAPAEGDYLFVFSNVSSDLLTLTDFQVN